jgi:hypothetical protein
MKPASLGFAFAAALLTGAPPAQAQDTAARRARSLVATC